MKKLAYRPNEAAELLSVGRNTIYDLIKAGELHSKKSGRARLIPASELERWLAERDGVPTDAA